MVVVAHAAVSVPVATQAPVSLPVAVAAVSVPVAVAAVSVPVAVSAASTSKHQIGMFSMTLPADAVSLPP